MFVGGGGGRNEINHNKVLSREYFASGFDYVRRHTSTANRNNNSSEMLGVIRPRQIEITTTVSNVCSCLNENAIKKCIKDKIQIEKYIYKNKYIFRIRRHVGTLDKCLRSLCRDTHIWKEGRKCFI